MISVVSGIRADMYQLYAQWMSLRYPQFDNPHPVIGMYKPEGIIDNISYYLWAIIGALFSSLLYPIVVVGFSLRAGASLMKTTVYSLGLLGTSALLFSIWGSLVGLMIYLYGFQNSLAVILAVGVAIVSVVLSVACHKYLGFKGMVAIGYPAIYTAIFLPPITAALVAPGVGDDILRQSVLFAEYILESFAAPLQIESWLRSTFELMGIYHIVLWLGVSLTAGWMTGLFIKISTIARPRDDN